MKFFVTALFCFALLAVASAADAGKFIAKSFYTMDSEGHMSDVHPISPNTAQFLNRERRALVIQSVASSSHNDDPVKFTISETNIDPADTRSGLPGKGHVVTTTGLIDKSGKVTYKTEEGYFDTK